MPSRPLTALVVGALLALPTVSAHARGSGAISGTVTDAESGQPIPGVCVDVRTEGGSLVGRGTTDREGRYEAARLPAGRFVVHVNGCPNDIRRAYTREYWRDAVALRNARRIDLDHGEHRGGVSEDLVGRAGRVKYVALDGVDRRIPDCPGGTELHPWRTIEFGMRCLRPGDELVVRGGTYTERVLPVTVPGRADAPIVVRAADGERVLIRGLVRLFDADHWGLQGIDVTSDGRRYGSGEYLVKFVGGTGWSFTHGEVWAARSYAAFRIESHPDLPASEPRGWRVADSCIHGTAATHEVGRDHNVYIDTHPRAGGGIFERNLVFDAPNGNNLKLGNEPKNGEGTSNVTVRFNTFWHAIQNVLAAGDSANNIVERNIVGKLIQYKDWYPNIRGINLDGGGNVAFRNLGADDVEDMVLNDGESRGGWADRDNIHPRAPRFDSDASCDGFHPRDEYAQWFGRYGRRGQPPPPPRPEPEPEPEPQPPPREEPEGEPREEDGDGARGGPPGRPQARPTDTACPPGQVPEDLNLDVPQDNPHEAAIDCVEWRGVAEGKALLAYGPTETVTRAQMATFIARTIDAADGRQLPDGGRDAFEDDDGSAHEDNIDRLAAAGIVSGVGSGRYGPTQTVTRAQMATFLVRAYAYSTGQELAREYDWFEDDDGSGHEDSIDAAAGAGLTGGTSDRAYSPGAPVRRDQMASFLARLLDAAMTS